MKLQGLHVVKTEQNEKRPCRRRSIIELEIGIERYQTLLEEPGLSAQQREEFLAALWSVIAAFIDLGYRVHPVHKATDFRFGEDLDQAIIRAVEKDWREAA